MLIDFGPGSRQLFTATVNQKVTYGLATTQPEPETPSRSVGRSQHHPMQIQPLFFKLDPV
jgi:hypothetical protein